MQAPKKSRNFYISYVKGAAMLGIVLIHLINWSDIRLSAVGNIMKESLYTGLLLFVLATGSVIFIAYEHRASLTKSSQRLLYRGAQLLLFYYLYNIVKLIIFDFSTQPFYYQFINIGTLTVSNILSFKSFTVPITILPTYSFLLALSPLLLLLHKKFRHPKSAVAILIAGLFIMNYLTPLPSLFSPIAEFLYANGYSIISVALWLLPFLIGFFLAQVGFEKHKRTLLMVSATLTLLCGAFLYMDGESLFPSEYQFPLRPYLIAFSLLTLSLLLYAFHFLHAQSESWIKKGLAAIRFIGDNTLHIYLYHWMVIDITIWIFSPHVWLIWFTTPLFFASYFFFKKKKLAEYHNHQENIVRDIATEIS